MSASIENVTVISCSVFQSELEVLRDRHWPGLRMRYIRSHLHVRPVKLSECVEAMVDEELALGRHVLLVYGDCFWRMLEIMSKHRVQRIDTINCCQQMLGRCDYRALAHDGAFFLLPEWASNWREVFTVDLGLDRSTAHEVMSDMHTRLVFLDTGVRPVPVEDLEACSEFCGLPWSVVQVPLNTLHDALQSSLTTLLSIGDAA